VTQGASERTSSGLTLLQPADDPLAGTLFPPLPSSVRWGLDRTERLLAALGDPHTRYPILHVGGTNGKGSVAAIWAGILRAAGFRTGLYTSPHLISFRERIRVDGRPIPDTDLQEWALDLRPLLLRERPSFFEAATVLALHAFERAEVDVAVVEVGLGGRLDATNVVTPVLTAITNVGWDHAPFLGTEIPQIAREKAGILKPGVPAFTASDDPEVLAVLAQEAATRGAILRRVLAPSEGRSVLEGSRLRVETSRWGPMELASPLVGVHQHRNLALAVRSLEALPPRLPVSAAAIREGVLRTRVPGRFQVERINGVRWIFDVAHNAPGVRALASTLAALSLPGPRVAVVGILADKEWSPMLSILADQVDVLVLTIPPSSPVERRWLPWEAAAGLPPERVRVVQDFDLALRAASEEAGSSGTVLVTGSTHTVGDALNRLDRVPREALSLLPEGG